MPHLSIYLSIVMTTVMTMTTIVMVIAKRGRGGTGGRGGGGGGGSRRMMTSVNIPAKLRFSKQPTKEKLFFMKRTDMTIPFSLSSMKRKKKSKQCISMCVVLVS